METDQLKQQEFNLRGPDSKLFGLVKAKLESEYGRLSNIQVIRLVLKDVARRKHIKFTFREEG